MDLSIRMKVYENAQKGLLLRKTPVIIRVDGKAFHSFTKDMGKPFDIALMISMDDAAKAVASEMQGFKFGYIQSDEASFFLSDYDHLENEPWFNNEKSKLESISASLMTGFFIKEISQFWCIKNKPIPAFDARAFNIPKEEVTNYFLWRAKDWERNSVQMLTRSYFSHKELIGKKIPDLHEMLYAKGVNWNDLSPREKNGCYIIRDTESERKRVYKTSQLLPTYDDLNTVLEQLIYPGDFFTTTKD